MTDQDAIEAQQALLRANRETLHTLLLQQSQLGAAYAPPAVRSGIAAARSAIRQAKQALRDLGAPAADASDDEPAATDASLAGAIPPPGGAVSAGGDAIVANVGAGAQHVVVGKDISISGDSPPSDDARALRRRLDALRAALATAKPQLDPGVAMMAEFQVQLLAGELGKPEGEPPSGTAVVQIGEWLLANAAPLRPALLALLCEPALLRSLANAGGGALEWVQRRQDDRMTG